MLVKFTSLTLSFLLTIILFFNGCGSATEKKPATRHSVQAPANIEQALEAAKLEASVHPEIDFDVEHATESELNHPLFEGYYFVYVWGPMGHSQSSPFAIAADGSSFKLPEDFSSLTDHANVRINSDDEALSLLKFYLNFQTVWPGTDYQKIIETYSDIPGYKAENEELASSLPNIGAVSIFKDASAWSVDFYSWRAINGMLFNWKVEISEKGNIQIDRMDVISENVGNYLSIE